jgi:exopolysaccharide biosynthesis predicted pyruvyltransferase EpsI
VDARTAVESLRARLQETLRPLVTPLSRFALIEFPNYANVGDSAIYLGQLAALRALGLEPPCFVCDLRTYNRAELSRHIGATGGILLTGGGGFGDVWPEGHALREEIVASFPRNPIIQLPQTIHFERAESLRRARAILNAHGNLTLLVRDRRSLEIARSEFQAPSVLCPDAAFALGPLRRPAPATRPILRLLRTDKESATLVSLRSDGPSTDWIDEPLTLRRALSVVLHRAVRQRPLRRLVRPALSRLYVPLAHERLHRGLTLLASGRVVITDRLHGHILCLLMGVPHVVLDNTYGKLSTFRDAWTADVDSAWWASTPAEASAIASRLVGGATG